MKETITLVIELPDAKTFSLEVPRNVSGFKVTVDEKGNVRQAAYADTSVKFSDLRLDVEPVLTVKRLAPS